MWWWMLACGQDPLAALGLGLEPEAPVVAEAPPTEPVVEAPAAEPAAEPAEPVDPAAVPEGEPVAEAPAPAPAPARFDPISVPEGPREDGGVKWEGVTQPRAEGPRGGRGQIGGEEDVPEGRRGGG